jgi:hypothetical protein
MDEIVRQAMAKWPNVPHCYGWLALDARGAWRMRDERAQALGLSGDKINNAMLLGFINRNYMHDERGRWYFQNGPQRVYVNLETAPYIAHTDPAQGFVLHTGEPLTAIENVWLTDSGELLLQSADKVAMVDDRDMTQCLAALRINGIAVEDERLLTWLCNPEDSDLLTLHLAENQIPVRRVARSAIPTRFGFAPIPQPDGQ